MAKNVFNTTVRKISWPEKGATFLLHQFVKDCKILHAIFLEFWHFLSNISNWHLRNKVGISDERLKKARKLIKYNTHVGLRERLGDNYEVRLGLGLHIGYSIEGAIGSYYKIDASYLSSHPRMAERMEGATKHYGVPNLITEELYNYFTETTKSYCR